MNDVLNTMLTSEFPETKRFSRVYMLKFQKLQILGVTLFFTLAKKIAAFQKVFKISTYSGVELCL